MRHWRPILVLSLLSVALVVGQWGGLAGLASTTGAGAAATTSTAGATTSSTTAASTTSTPPTSTTGPGGPTTTTLPVSTVGQPALAADFPDPTVLVVGGTYYAFATEVGFVQIQETSSVDLTHWAPIGDALPSLPAWANPFHTWAPSVTQIGTSFVMYYTVQDAASGRQCISFAIASQPAGPFTDSSTGPFICQLGIGGSIDPAVFASDTGTLFLTWKNDGNAVGAPTAIWAQQLTPDGEHLVGAAVELLRADQAWESGIVEGPGMVVAGGRYDLFYTGGQWSTARAAIGYATCASALGPCTKVSTGTPWLASQGAAAGPGSPAFFSGADGRLRMAFDAWDPTRIGYAAGGQRSMWIDDLAITSGGPVASADQPLSPRASYLTVQVPQDVDPNQPFTMTVTARNAGGAVATSYAGTVRISSTDLRATLPSEYTFKPADGGAHLFSAVSLGTAGAQQITVTDTATPAITGATSVAVSGVPVTAGGTVWSDSHGGPPNAGQPLVVGVTSPSSGAVLIVTGQSVSVASPGYRALPEVAHILAPAATPAVPITLTLELASSALGGPVTPGTVVVYDHGVLVTGCEDAAVAAPDPCVTTESIAFGLVVLTVRSSSNGVWSFGVSKVVRVAGADRTDTAIAVSRASYSQPGSASVAVIARSDDFPDALAGTPLAVADGGPLLVTTTDGLDPRAAAELTRALPAGRTVYVLGGVSALSDGVTQEVAALGFSVVRLGGADRYATAALIADQGLEDPTTVFEATGLDFADALAAGTAAAAVHGAVLLTSGPVLPGATRQYLAQHPPVTRYAVGGPAVAADPGAGPLVGADRYATSALLAARFFRTPATIGIASGANWPDALSGGTRQGGVGGPLLLSDPATLPDAASAYLVAHAASIATVEVYGGSAALGDQVLGGVGTAIS